MEGRTIIDVGASSPFFFFLYVPPTNEEHITWYYESVIVLLQMRTFSNISWREQITFDGMVMIFALY